MIVPTIRTQLTPRTLRVVVFSAWFAFWVCDIGIPSLDRSPIYYFLILCPRNYLDAHYATFDNETIDFYHTLRFCDRTLPPDRTIRLVFSEKISQKKFEFLRDKGRYYLYPRNYGNNQAEADYILVYGNQDFNAPENFELIHTFASGKYLLARKDLL